MPTDEAATKVVKVAGSRLGYRPAIAEIAVMIIREIARSSGSIAPRSYNAHHEEPQRQKINTFYIVAIAHH